ncbi:unnamed protein product [Prorocentrum cordatum]|uniref:Uncharacterized protein n=1 Tax=Prorocentrum cordatum TaxID=2364126 RepID=A0ABN9QX81_9DINO|nr:unnamed protein product [Polarella glacialis]
MARAPVASGSAAAGAAAAGIGGARAAAPGAPHAARAAQRGPEDWRASAQQLGEQLDAGTATKKAYMQALKSLAGDLDQQTSAEETAERYRCFRGLRERVVAAFAAERGSPDISLLYLRLAARAGDPDTALELLRDIKRPKLRDFLPILLAYASQGAHEKAEVFYREHLRPLRARESADGMQCLDSNLEHRLGWERVFAARLAAWSGAALRQSAAGASDATGSSSGRIGSLQDILKDVTEVFVWITRGDALEAALREACGAAGWRVAEDAPDETGLFSASGTRLRTALAKDELDQVEADIDDLVAADIKALRASGVKPVSKIAVTSEELQELELAWPSFKKQVADLEGDYQAVIDGANVGQQMQNWDGGCFQWRAIDAVLEAHQKAGRRAMVVLRNRWRFAETSQLSRDMPQESASIKRRRAGEAEAPAAATDASNYIPVDQRTEVELAKRWRENGQIMVAPRGINDDNVAMLIAVVMCRRGVPDVQLVTNDFLRDHKRKADQSRPLRLWLDRHVSRYTLKYVSPDGEERYLREEAEADVLNGAEAVPERLLKPGELEGVNLLHKVRLFPPLRYIAPAQGHAAPVAWHFPLGSDWIFPRGQHGAIVEPPTSKMAAAPRTKPKGSAAKRQVSEVGAEEREFTNVDSIAEARARFERIRPTYLVAWAPDGKPV